MGYLLGLQEYLEAAYRTSVFQEAVLSGQSWELHLHEARIVTARITEDLKYDIKARIEGQADELLPKLRIKVLYPADLADSIRPHIKLNEKVRDSAMEPVQSPGKRHHIKNKSLFPLMKDRTVVFFTLLEGETLKGIISGFSRYEISLNLKGGIPVTVLRHSILDLRDKKGRCFLKSFQEKHRDWEKSSIFVPTPPA